MFVCFSKQSYVINMLYSEPLQFCYTSVHGILFNKTGKSKPVQTDQIMEHPLLKLESSMGS